MSIFGVHDLSDHFSNAMRDADKRGWLVDAVAIGCDPTDDGGADYRYWEARGHTIICRLNNGWWPNGTIPSPSHYSAFALRCANFVRASQGCHIWVIGNEWNLSVERPHDRIITVRDYVSCYRQAYDAIKAVAPSDWVVPAAIGPWNIETGDWLELYRQVLAEVDADALCWHLYTHGSDPALLTSDAKMEPPYEDRHYHFRAYKDLESWTPDDKKSLPVLVTEANQNGQWEATGWIPAAYAEIRKSQFDIRCMCLFRAKMTGDGYNLEGKPAVEHEFECAMEATEEEEDVSEEYQEVYVHRMERGTYDQSDKSEFTLPLGFSLYYCHDPTDETKYNEPEMDMKDAERHPEVKEGRFSATGFFLYSTGVFWLVTEPIYVQNGRALRASAWYMHVFDNAGGGARLGIVNGSGNFDDSFSCPPQERGRMSLDVTWGGWASSYDGVPDREWVQLTTPTVVPTRGAVRVVIEFASNDAGFGAGHFDVVRLEQQLGGSTPPVPPGGDFDWVRLRRVMREELDKTKLGSI